MAVKEETDLLERLAYLEHAQWVEWMKYFISKCLNIHWDDTSEGDKPINEITLRIPLEDWERWQSQIKRNYHALTEQEKESDRKFARKVMEILDSGNEKKTTTITKREQIILPKLERKTMWDIQKWILESQMQIQHLLYHQDQQCWKNNDPESESHHQCYPDFDHFICPRCWNGPGIFEGWNQTDRHDTYIGFKCRSCNYDYCISH